MRKNRSCLNGLAGLVGGLLVMSGCVDSELTGQPPPRDDALTDTGLGGDTTSTTDATADTTTTPPDTTAPDITDTSVDTDTIGPDAGCTSDEACRDVLGPLGDCEAAFCDLPTGQCKTVDTCVSCTNDADCQGDAPVCTRAACELGDGQSRCVYERTNACCEGSAACDDMDPCTADRCSGGYCQSPALTGQGAASCCAVTPVVATSFAPPPAFQWRSDVTDAGWKVVDSSFATSPEAVLYLGNTSTMNAYSADKSYFASASFPLGKVTANTALEIRFRLFVDLRTQAGVDYFWVVVRDAQNQQIILINRPEMTFGQWMSVYREVELPNEGPWTLFFEFNSATQPDVGDADHTGILVDDLEVQVGCASGCEPGTACPSDDPCVVGRCGQDRECVYEAVPNCGECTPERCNDGDPCTRDFCGNVGCENQPIPNCQECGSCDDNNPCTIDRCDPQTGECRYEQSPQCCVNNEQCRDGDFCTADFCADDGTCRHEPLNVPGCDAECDADGDCNDGQFCTVDVCDGGACRYAQRACDDDDPCTIDFCDGQGCQHLVDPACGFCTEQTLWSRAFVEGETPDLQIDGNSFTVGWRVDDTKSSSPERSLRYGDEDGEDYASPFGGRTFGRATGPFIAVPQAARGVRLTFNTYIDIDDDDDHDQFVVRLLIGQENEVVWDRTMIGGTTNGQWVPVTIDLPAEAIGQSIRLRWLFDTVDGDDNDGEGAFVDDIVVRTTCPAP